jgi:hypothetical protein
MEYLPLHGFGEGGGSDGDSTPAPAWDPALAARASSWSPALATSPGTR